MESKKLSLAELKAKAGLTNQAELLEKVQGGALEDCHGRLGQIEKSFYNQIDKAIDRIGTWWNSK